jgi:rod shape-determining protein MreD
VRTLVLTGWIIALGLGQALLSEHVAVFGVAPDFLALFPIFVAMYASRGEAIQAALLSGLAYDVLFSGRLGPMTLCLALGIAAVVGVRPRKARADGWEGMVAVGLTVFAVNLLYGGLGALGWGAARAEEVFVTAGLIGLYTGLTAVLVFPAMLAIATRLGYPERCGGLHGDAYHLQGGGPSGYPVSPRDSY